MSSSNAVCASRFFSRGWEGSRRIIAFDAFGDPGGRRRRNAFCRSIDAQKDAFFFREKKNRKSARRNSRLRVVAQILGVLEIAVRGLPLLLGGSGGQRRGSAEGPLADGARRGMRARLAELREERSDEVRRLANELPSSDLRRNLAPLRDYARPTQ